VHVARLRCASRLARTRENGMSNYLLASGFGRISARPSSVRRI